MRGGGFARLWGAFARRDRGIPGGSQRRRLRRILTGILLAVFRGRFRRRGSGKGVGCLVQYVVWWLARIGGEECMRDAPLRPGRGYRRKLVGAQMLWGTTGKRVGGVSCWTDCPLFRKL